ncbi:MAG: NAD(P)H-dependent oxidoreductase [Thermodesulfobacteriota bacterium]|nr:NAD(P)H-dependent oxidoreductase [Thermodesulfobacteriota bacterium]
MLVLGLQGSPRIKGNTSILLTEFLGEAERIGANTCCIDVSRKDISPCQECGNCEKKGYCPIDDDMQQIYPLLRRAEIIVMATPVFFYGPTAQLKALIDRSQTLWARRYVHSLVDPGRRWRQGVLLSVGATKGHDLFQGIGLTAKYFFDALGARFEGAQDSLTYRQVEEAGEIKQHPTALPDARQKARALVPPFVQRKKILFLSTADACRSQMASALAQYHWGDRMEIESAGTTPAPKLHPFTEEVMEEKGIDMAFREPKTIDEATRAGMPELVVSVGHEEARAPLSNVPKHTWDLSDPSGQSIEFIREMRHDIENRLEKLIPEWLV